MKQRLGVAMALIGNPKLLILDEPINGLDPQGIAEMRDIILELNKEYQITVIISSHIPIDFEGSNRSEEGMEKECREKGIDLEDFYFNITGRKKNV